MIKMTKTARCRKSAIFKLITWVLGVKHCQTSGRLESNRILQAVLILPTRKSERNLIFGKYSLQTVSRPPVTVLALDTSASLVTPYLQRLLGHTPRSLYKLTTSTWVFPAAGLWQGEKRLEEGSQLLSVAEKWTEMLIHMAQKLKTQSRGLKQV